MIPQDLGPYAMKARLVDMIDFQKVEFNKAVSLNPRQTKNILSKYVYKTIKIREICDIGRGRVINNQYIEKNKGKYPVYSSQSKDFGIMGYIDTYDFDGEYITWTTDGIYAGTCFYRNGKFNCTNVCGTLKIADTKIIIYKYLAKILSVVTPYYVTKVANPKLMNNTMAELQIPLPPLEIQEKIVQECEFLENQNLNIKELIQNYKNLITAIFVKLGITEKSTISAQMKDFDNLDSYIKNILQSIKEREINLARENLTLAENLKNTIENLPNIPKNGWKQEKIGDTFTTASGGTPLTSINEYYQDGTIKWVNSGELKTGIITDTAIKITQLGLKNSSAKIFPIHTVLVAMYGATTGEVGILETQASTNQAICGILPDDNKALPYFLYFTLRSMKDSLKKLSRGTARSNISQEIIKTISIPLPPIESQKIIVHLVEKIENNIKTLEAKLPILEKGQKEVLEKYLQ